MKRLVFVLCLASLAGCDAAREQVEEAGQSIVDLTVREVGNLAASILDDPGRAEEILEASGVTVERLDSLMYEIATDAESRAEYLAALDSR